MSDRSPDISIVLLTYNGDIYLAEVLASIFAQITRFNFEVIAIDSGSSDRTLEIIKDYPVTLVVRFPIAKSREHLHKLGILVFKRLPASM